MKKQLLIILAISCVATSIPLILYLSSFRPNLSKNGFSRKTIQTNFAVRSRTQLNGSDYYIAGIGDKLYLYSKVPGELVTVSSDLKSIDDLKISLPDSIKSVLPIRVMLINSDIYFMAMNKPAIVRYNLKTNNIEDAVLANHFSQSVGISENSFVLRMYQRSGNGADFTIGKVKLENTNIIWNRDAIENNLDGGFSTDGMLNYDSYSHKLLYVFYYSNQIICMDTNLNVLYRSHSIDTFTNHQIKVRKFGNGNNLGYTVAAPPNIINSKTCTWSGDLYNISTLKADNESEGLFYKNVVIDVYKIQDGTYKGSIYLPNETGNKINDFRVTDSLIYILAGNQLLSYNYH